MYDPANNPMEPGRRNVNKVVRNEILKGEPLKGGQSSFKKFAYFVYGFFAVGFFMRFFHVSGAGFFLWTGFICMLLLVIIQIAEGYNKNFFGRTLLLGSIHFSVIYLFFRFQEWDTAIIVFLMCSLMFVLGLIYFIRENKKIGIVSGITALVLIGAIFIALIPDYVFYYNINLTETFHSHTRENNSWIWNKHSWKSFDDAAYDEALQSNIMAMVIAARSGYDQLARDYYFEIKTYMWPKSTILTESEINNLERLLR